MFKINLSEPQHNELAYTQSAPQHQLKYFIALHSHKKADDTVLISWAPTFNDV